MRGVSQHPEQRIVVGGEALVDLVNRPDGMIQPLLGGGPYNTARTIGRLGSRVDFLGGLSTDRFGRQLAAALERDGVGSGLVQCSDAPTTLAMVELDEHGSASYRFYFDGTAAPALVAPAAPIDAAAVHVGTLGLVLEPMASVLEVVVGSLHPSTLTMIDANCRPVATADHAAYGARLERVLRSAHVLKVSSEDLDFLGSISSVLGDTASLLALGPRVVLLTRGGDGVDIVTVDGCEHVDAVPVDVVDTIGAGDAFGGGFLARWVQSGHGVDDLGRADLVRSAVELAARVAAITCGRAGADPPHARDVQGWDTL